MHLQTYTLGYMSFVAVVSTDPNLNSIFFDNLYTENSFHLINTNKPIGDVCKALIALDYSGAIVLEPKWQSEVLNHSQRNSLASTRHQACDSLIVTPAGLIADYVLGSALNDLLVQNHWDVRGAHVAITGSGPIASAVATELASAGVEQISVIAETLPNAEKTLPHIALTRTRAYKLGDSNAAAALERADLLVRTESQSQIAFELLGPHLSVIDLSPSPFSSLRQNALSVGAKTLGLRDLQAHQLALSLGLITGKKLDSSVFLHPLLALD